MNLFLRPGDVIDKTSRKNVGSYIRLAEKEQRNAPYVEGDELATIYLRLDAFQDYSERTLFSFVELCADVGGLTELVFILGLAFTEIFTGKLFVAEMISQLYMVSKSKPSSEQ